jgi:hypothetical protein
MQRVNVEQLREAIRSARDAVEHSHLDACDASDLEELLDPVERELNVSTPNLMTLATYLNSLARSLRAQPGARGALKELDQAMRASGVPTQWEH